MVDSDAKLVLKKLKEGDISNLSIPVSEILSVSEEDERCKKLVIFTAQFLHSVKDVVFNGQCSVDLIHSTIQCSQFYRRHRDNAQNVVKELSMQQLLYHIMAKVPWKTYVEELLECGEEMYNLLVIVKHEVNGIAPIAQNSFGLIWRTAGELEKNNKFSDFSFSFKLRILSLKLQLLKVQTDDSISKLALSVERYGSLMKTKQMCVQKIKEEIRAVHKAVMQFLKILTKDFSVVMSVANSLRINCQILKLLLKFELFEDYAKYLSSVEEPHVPVLSCIYLLCIAASGQNFCETELQNSFKASNNNELVSNKQLIEIWADLFAFAHSQMRSSKLLENIQSTLLLNSVLLFYQKQEQVIVYYLKRLKDVESNGEQKVVQYEKILVELLKSKIPLYLKVLVMLPEDERDSYIKVIKDTTRQDLQTLQIFSDKTLSHFKKVYGNGLEKLGLFCYNNDNLGYEIYFAELSCQLLTSYYLTSKQQATNEECHLCNVYDNLAEYYRKNKKWRNGLETIVKCLIIEPKILDTKNLTILVKRWIHIKLSAVDFGDVEYYQITLKSVCVDGHKITNDLLINFLKLELQILQKKNVSIGEYYVIKQLVDLSTYRCDKAAYLILLASSNWSIDIQDLLKPEEYIELALCLFTDIQSKNGMDSIIEGQIYLWKYLLLHEQTCKMLYTVKDNKEDDVIDNVEQSNSEEKTTSDENCKLFSLADENKMLFFLNKAVRLWSESYTTQIEDTTQKQYFLESLKLTASIYNVLKQPVQESEVLAMLKSVCLDNETGLYKVNMDIVRLLTSLGLYETSLDILLNVKKPTTNNDILLYKIRHIEASLSQCIDQQNENLLYEVEADLQSQKDTTACLLRGTTNRLLSTVSTLHMGDNSTGLHYALDHGHDAVRLHTSVNHFFLEKKNKGGGGIQQKWLVINEVLESLLNLVQLYRYVGDDSMARCYAREGIRIARGLLLPRWCLLFKFELCRIHSITYCLKDAQDVLYDVSSILYPSESIKLHFNPKSLQSSSNSQILNKKQNTNDSQRKQSLTDDCFGFESILDAGMDVMPDRKLHITTESASSKEVTIPDHNSNCTCVSCNDQSLLDITSKYWFLLAEACYHNKNYAQSEQLLNKVLLRYEQTSPGIQDHLLKIKQTFSSAEVSCTQSLPSLYHRNLFESYCLLAECSLYINSPAQSQTVCQKTLKLLDSNTHKNVEQNVLRARVNMCLVQLELAKVNCTNSDPSLDFKSLFSCNNITEDVDNLTSKLKNCQLTKQNPNDGNKSKIPAKKLIRKIQFDSPAPGSHFSDTSLLVPMEVSPDIESDVDDIVTESPDKICKALFLKTPLKGKNKKSSNLFIYEDDVFESEPRSTMKSSRPSKPCNKAVNRCKLSTVGTPSDVKSGKAGTGRKCKLNDSTIDSVKRSSRKTNPSKTPLKIVSSFDHSDSEADKTEDSEISKTKSNPIKIKSKASNKLEFNETIEEHAVTKSVNKRKPKRSIKKSTLDLDSENESNSTASVENNKARSTRKGKVGKENLDTENTVGKVTFNTESTVTPMVGRRSRCCKNKAITVESPEDVFSFDEAGSPIKTKRSTRKKPVKSTKKSVSSAAEIERCPDGTPDRKFSIEFETIHEMSPDINSCESPSQSRILDKYDEVSFDEYDIEIMRGKSTTATRNKGGRKEQNKDISTEILRSEITGETNLKNSPEQIIKKQPTSEGTVSVDRSQIISTLEKAYEQVRHFPSNPYYPVICKLLALQYILICPYKTAFYLTESAAVTFRHQTLVDIGRKMRNLKKGKTEVTNIDKQLEMFDNVRQSLVFNKEQNHLTTMLSKLPQECTVCQISVIEKAGSSSEMLLTRLSRDVTPITVCLPAYNSSQGKDILEDFKCILEESAESVKTDNKHEFWKNRRLLDEKIQAVQADMQNVWLGSWKNLLLGQFIENEEYKVLQSLVLELDEVVQLSAKHQQLIKILVTISDELSCVELAEILSTLIPIEDKTVLKTLVTTIQHVSSEIVSLDLLRHPIILILDKTIQHLPWESIDILRSHSVSRVPSLYSLYTQLMYLETSTDNVYHQGVDTNKTYYVINPDDNLCSTQQFFITSYQHKEGWKGVIGERPTASQYIEGLTQNDLFIYCGHGDGVKYFQGDEIQKLNCRASVLLMGCSSGLLKPKGQLDACGTILNYFLAGCPCVVGTLWNITDKEIDRFCKCLLDTWLESKPGTSLLQVVPKAREACRLLYLTGSAPIIYGLPVFKK